MAKIIVVTSGKGGVGKTTSSAAISSGLAMRGHKTVVIDFDIGLRNLDIIMGCERRVVYDFINVINVEASLKQALIKDKRLPDLFILPASQTRDKDALKIEGKHPVLALHLKSTNQNEVAYTALSAIFKQYNLHNQAFIFDLTLEAARTCKQIDPEIDIALIISDEKFEPTIHLWDEVKLETCFDIVWAAEYRSMYTKELFLEMQQLKGRVYAMSPDVHKALGHPLAESGYEETWKKLIEWKVNGICTDEPYKLQQLLKAQTL